MLRRPTLTLAVLAGTGLAGCTLLYPRFDSLLNPDLAFLNAGDVVDSVKCAVTTFFINHRADIETGARLKLAKQLKQLKQLKQPVEGGNFCPKDGTAWSTDWSDPRKDPPGWRLVFVGRAKNGCEADHSLILQANDAEKDDDKNVTIIINGRPLGNPIEYRGAAQLVQDLATHPEIRPKLQAAGQDCKDPFYHVYKYVRFEDIKDSPFNKHKGRCVPNGGCRPGTFFREKGKCGLDNAGRLAIDPDSDASIDLTLTAVNTGSMSYQRIDATRLDILGGIIVPGGVAGAAFPGLKATDRKTNKVEISILMPQGRVQEDKPKGFIRTLVEAVELAKLWEPQPKKGAPLLGPLYEPLAEKEYERLRRLVLEDLTKAAGDYEQRCASNDLKVGYLGLANYIDKIVTEQEKRIYKGTPDVSLDKFVLTSQFQISFDASAGTQNLLRIVPVLQPPVLQLAPDHTHTLKITFKGNKGRRTKAKALSILRKCRSRLENTLGSEEAAYFCKKPEAILLESLIDAVESKSSSSAAN